MDTTQIKVIAEIVQILELSKDEISKINDDFNKTMDIEAGTTIDMIRACKVYDPAAFLAGCMIATSVIDLVRANQHEKMAELNRLEGNHMDAM